MIIVIKKTPAEHRSTGLKHDRFDKLLIITKIIMPDRGCLVEFYSTACHFSENKKKVFNIDPFSRCRRHGQVQGVQSRGF